MSGISLNLNGLGMDLKDLAKATTQWDRVLGGLRCGLSIFHFFHPNRYANVVIDEITLLAPHPLEYPSVRGKKIDFWNELQDAAIKFAYDDNSARLVFTSSSPDFFRHDIGSCWLLLAS